MGTYDFLTTSLTLLNAKIPTRGSHNFRLCDKGGLVLFMCLDQYDCIQEFGYDPSEMESAVDFVELTIRELRRKYLDINIKD